MKKRYNKEIYNIVQNKKEIIEFLTSIIESAAYTNKKKRFKIISSKKDITKFIEDIKNNKEYNKYMYTAQYTYYNNVIYEYSYNMQTIRI